jgi:hypothetical protein
MDVKSMKTKFFLCFLLLFNFINAEQSNKKQLTDCSCSIVFVHTGKIPGYVITAIHQARLFNSCPIVLIGDELTDSQNTELSKSEVIYIPCNSLEKSPEHIHFLKTNTLRKKFRNNFWVKASERFFYIDSLMNKYSMQHVVQIETDNLLYVDIKELLPTLKKHYPCIAIPNSSDHLSIPSVVYFRNKKAIRFLTSFMSQKASQNVNDMRIFNYLNDKEHPGRVKGLPVVHSDYLQYEDVKTDNPNKYCSHIDEFNSIFDPAYLGIYLDGSDPRNCKKKSKLYSTKPGFINPFCIIKANKIDISWERDIRGLNIPFSTYKNKKYRINNLHMHSKHLEKFLSKESK